jgi:1,4-dihydroxy-2-naphthoyl-CoA hydrolase
MINTKIALEEINALNKSTMMAHLGIEYIEINENFIIAKMPVDHRTHQPMGLLHGGASAALIESLGSLGSALCIDLQKKHIVGLEINANHLKSERSGFVYGKAILIHEGRSTHVWQVDVTNEKKELVSSGRLTVLVKNNNNV